MNEAVTAVPNDARVWKAGALAAVLASVVNVLIYLIADGLIEGQIAVPRLPDLGREVEQLPIVVVIAFSAVPILLGTLPSNSRPGSPGRTRQPCLPSGSS